MLQRHFQPQLQGSANIGEGQLPQPFHAGEIPVWLHIIRNIDNGLQQIHIGLSRSVGFNGGDHCFIFPKNPPGNQAARKRMEGFWVFSGKIIQYSTIGGTQCQLQRAVQGLGNVVQQPRPGGIRLVRPPFSGQGHRRIPAAQNVVHPAGIQQADHHRLQSLHREIPKIGFHIVK